MKTCPSLLILSLLVGGVQAAPHPAALIHIAPEQTLRLNVTAPDDEPADGPCKVFMGFFDRHGKPTGPRFAKHIVLAPGQTVYLDIAGHDVQVDRARRGQVALLPTVRVEQEEGGQTHHCPGVMAGVEVFDRDAGPDVVSVQKSM